jgi:hypothetical protein
MTARIRCQSAPPPAIGRRQLGASDWWFIAPLLLLLLAFGVLRWESFLARHIDYELFSPGFWLALGSLILALLLLTAAALVVKRFRRNGNRFPKSND